MDQNGDEKGHQKGGRHGIYKQVEGRSCLTALFFILRITYHDIHDNEKNSSFLKLMVVFLCFLCFNRVIERREDMTIKENAVVERVQKNLEIDPAVWKKLHFMKADSGKKLYELLEEAINEKFEEYDPQNF
ncbi:hypothetical protein PPK14_gp35 [Bacillus phage vB_BspS_SplendidRed]|uniref:Uncharacterized protein n=1 Tax=Bacillus phage vB_BspS_SplendidRed TaxID=2591379 RepID=A0A5B9NIK1_9CAUD|nr:hypothetical protein PPK14_gp35 [Bacillus phage vB_BspS_SplendidRed]QEG13509.1 hypothetical protein SPLENDIDRED_35 [Bacillus phage vB_BspS_SplendidRed]